MKHLLFFLLVPLLTTACNAPKVKQTISASGPIRLHPENRHYFLYKGEALALVSSAEHYGAVINENFDYHKYLETLARDGMNYTRIFTGTYFEIHGESFGIQHNTLAPVRDSIMTPWKTVKQPSGKIKYDLSRWNPDYFNRLKDFISSAAGHNIIVEVTLFSSIYNDRHWAINPQNPVNNINIDRPLSRLDAQTLNNGPLLEYQLSFVRKIVRELNNFDNFFFELQNEPWFDHPAAAMNIVNKDELRQGDWGYKADLPDPASMAWQDSIAAVITREESQLSSKHLIALDYTNFKAPIPEVSPYVSIINFHYAWPEAVEWNYQYDRVIGFDESGFAGQGDKVYRQQAWRFMLSGGGLFNNLDYSFYPGHEDGLGKNQAPGGGSAGLRRQLKILHDFLNSFALEKLHPAKCSVTGSPGLIPFVLSSGDGQFAVFLQAVGTAHSTLELKTGQGRYVVRSLNTLTGEYSEPKDFRAVNGSLIVDLDIPDGEMALKIVRK